SAARRRSAHRAPGSWFRIARIRVAWHPVLSHPRRGRCPEPVVRDARIQARRSGVAGKRDELVPIAAGGVAEADATASAQRHLFALELDGRLALDGDVGAVRAVVDEHELAAATL